MENPPTRMVTSMSMGGGGGPPGQAPPDLPSLLLNARICYLGMPVRVRPTPNHAVPFFTLHK